MDRREIVEFLKFQTDHSTLRELLNDSDAMYEMVLLINGVVSSLRITGFVDLDDILIARLHIPGQYWAVHYIAFEELHSPNRLNHAAGK